MNLFIHHKDMRTLDNTTLIDMCNNKIKNIIPIFILTPKQINKKINKYFNNNFVQFMCESLLKLQNDYVKKNRDLLFFYGDTLKVLKEIHNKYKIDNIGFNVSYSPFGQKRDNRIITWAKKNKISIHQKEDEILHDLLNNKTKKKDGLPYKVFTPFYKKLRNNRINLPDKKFSFTCLKKNPKIEVKYHIKKNILKSFYKEKGNLFFKSGRRAALEKLSKIEKSQKGYNVNRNYLSYRTTELSAYINLGTLSIREVYHYCLDKLGEENKIIDELYWRDFYINIMYFFPHVIGNSFTKKYDKLKWNNDMTLFRKWCNGETGFPIVDACMKQLNETGYMHNRGRMIVASFLTKDLLIDWRLGEKYFAKKLIDYSISSNNGGWQWSSSTGTDSQPYFRIFNPWSQSKKFDPNCTYIKKWLPELKNVASDAIHNWKRYNTEYSDIRYPKPIVDHSTQRKKTLKIFQRIQ